jgi:hypothetical protein
MTEAQKKQILVIGVVLVLLAGIFAALKVHNNNAEDTATEDTVYVSQTALEDVTSFSWQVEDQTYTLTKTDDGWTCAEYPDMELDTDAVEALLENITPLEANQQVEDPDSDDVYALDDPQTVITCTTADGTSTYSLGMENEITGGTYLKVEEDGSVYLVDSTLVTTFSCDIASLEKEEEETESSVVSETSETEEAAESSVTE